MKNYMENLIKEVGAGNPGGYKVIKELMWFSHWEKMLRYFKEIELVGGALWARCSDDYHLDFHAFGYAIDREMSEYYAKNHKPVDFKGQKMPKFL